MPPLPVGRDFAQMRKALSKSGAQIVTVVGRYFAMDRDRRWDRPKRRGTRSSFGQGEQREDLASRSSGRQI